MKALTCHVTVDAKGHVIVFCSWLSHIFFPATSSLETSAAGLGVLFVDTV